MAWHASLGLLRVKLFPWVLGCALSQRVFILPNATECLLSISDVSETITSMEAAPPNMALGCVPSTSVTNPQNVLPLSAEPLVSIPNVILPPDTSRQETTFSSF